MSDIDSNKEKALTAALSQIERQFGKGAMMRLGDSPQEKIPSISTGSLGLDVALGIGGLPKEELSKYMALSLQGRPRLLYS